MTPQPKFTNGSADENKRAKISLDKKYLSTISPREPLVLMQNAMTVINFEKNLFLFSVKVTSVTLKYQGNTLSTGDMLTVRYF